MVGPSEGSKARAVLMTPEELDAVEPEVSEDSPAPLMVAPFRLDSLRDPPPPSRRRPRPGRHVVHSHRRRRPGRRLVLLAALLVLVAAGAVVVGVRASSPDPPPVVTPVLARTVGVPRQAVTLPWPATGQGAIAIPAIGVDMASGPEQPVPVASLTKLMTAYVVLHDHPLAPHEPGPTITVTQADVDDYDTDTVADDANAQVALDEKLTERQVMSGLLVHSADNYADLLARWDAGSIPAFVAKMNAAAARLGMGQSHWADASGVSPSSVSTAADMLKVAAPDMANAEIASIVKMTSVTLARGGDDLHLHAAARPGGDHRREVRLHDALRAGATWSPWCGRARSARAAPRRRDRADRRRRAGAGRTARAGAGQRGRPPDRDAPPVLHGGQVVAHVSEAGRTVDAQAAASAVRR